MTGLTHSHRPVGARSLAARSSAASALEPGLLRALAGGAIGRLILVVPDPHARFAAVELDRRFVADEVLTGGYGVCSYVFAWDVQREALSDVDTAGPLGRYLRGFGDLKMVPDLATAIPLPGDGRTWAAVCDVAWPDGESVSIAPRQVLTDQLRALEESSLMPSAGIEHEVVFRDAQGKPLTEHGVDYALGGTERMAPVLREVRDALEETGLGVESARAECHPGQYEIVLRHRDALAACDDALLQQWVVREAAARQGVQASYLAAPETGQGSSCHVHLSLSTLDGDSASSVGGTQLSETMGHFLAGVLRDARALTAIWAPTWNSYVRLRTAPFSPRTLRWGIDDRTASVRVAGKDSSLRLEFRFAGADAQPHLVVSALLAAGRAGIEDRLPVPASGADLGSLATSPWEALSALTEGGRVAKLLGEDVAAQQVALLESEIDAACTTVTDLQRSRSALRS
ncbi:MAG: glutamine synthetase [Actinomycetota bacterium]|nr:glutamine synthetase [Actinomycetota bacterium]